MGLLKSISFVASHPLNRNRKLRSIGHYLKWQVGTRLLPGDVVFSWLGNSKFLVRAGETGLTGNVYTGLHEFADMAFVLHTLRKDDLFIDVGANSGSYTILACAVVGARGYAFEPAPAAFGRLIENVRLNRLDTRVECRNVAVGREAGRASFSVHSDTMNHLLAGGEVDGRAVEIAVSPLDLVLVDESPAVMKIDVEGFEQRVLEGATETLGKPTLLAVLLELNGSGTRYGFDERDILDFMRAYDFAPYSYEPFSRSLRSLSDSRSTVANTLFVRDAPAVRERIRSAPRFAIGEHRV